MSGWTAARANHESVIACARAVRPLRGKCLHERLVRCLHAETTFLFLYDFEAQKRPRRGLNRVAVSSAASRVCEARFLYCIALALLKRSCHSLLASTCMVRCILCASHIHMRALSLSLSFSLSLSLSLFVSLCLSLSIYLFLSPPSRSAKSWPAPGRRAS